MLLGHTHRENFDNEKFLNQIVFVVSFDCENIQQEFEVYDNYEEARQRYDCLKRYNKDKKWSYTLDKSIVKSDELETIEEYE